MVEGLLNDASLDEAGEVRIIHGKGNPGHCAGRYGNTWKAIRW